MHDRIAATGRLARIVCFTSLAVCPALHANAQDTTPPEVGTAPPPIEDKQATEAAASFPVDAAARAVGAIAEPGGILEGARGVVTIAQLDDVLIWREGKGPAGEAALRQLLEIRILDAMGKDAGIVVDDERMRARFRELDEEAKLGGMKGGLEELVRTQGVPMKEFKRYLRLSIIHADLTRRALEIPEGTEVTAEEQNLWLKGAIEKRGMNLLPHPFDTGVVATSGDVTIDRDEYGEHLRSQMPKQEVSDACYMILLERAVLARMPELNDKGVEGALDRELERREAEIKSDPKYQGASYEAVLNAQGLTREAVRRDPAIRAAALAHESIDRAYDADALRETYNAKKRMFDATFGEAVDIFILYRYASEDPNNPLTPPIDQVWKDLQRMRGEIDGPEEFKKAIQIHSQHVESRERDGMLGALSRAGISEDIDALRAAAFETVDGATEGHGKGSVFGPVRMANGVALAMLGDHRPDPTWAKMQEYVHTHLRRAFLVESLPQTSVEVLLFTDTKPAEASSPTGDKK